jgi:nitrilase
MSAALKVAVVQAASVAFDLERCLHKTRQLAADAARRGARIAVFPEAFLSGYPKGSSFGAVVGARTDAGREEYRLYWESAVDVPGPAVDFLARVARENALYLVIGAIERDGGTLYCTVLHFAPDGNFLGKHRKLMPTAAERLIWGFGDGSTLPVYDTPHGRLGSVICWENYMPLLRTAMYSKGVEIWCAPTADGRDSWIPSMQHIAFEGRCFVLSCNQFSRRCDFPADFPCSLGDDPATIVSRGGSCIVDPFGAILAGPHYEGETILTAEIDRGQIARGKYDFDVVGHYARPDVFQLTVDERPKSPVVTLRNAVGGERLAGEES